MRTLSYTLGAGETVEISAGNFFQYLTGEDPIKVEFWRGSAKLADESADIARPGYVAEPQRQQPRGNSQGEPVGFTNARITTDTAQTIEIGVSMGEGGYNRFTGDTKITSPLGPNDAVAVEDQGSGDSFADLLSLLKNAADQRAALTTLAGATYTEANKATVTVVSSSNNTNGVVIARAMVEQNDDAYGGAAVEISGNMIVGRKFVDNVFLEDRIKDVFVPPGESVVLRSPNHTYVWAWTRKL